MKTRVLALLALALSILVSAPESRGHNKHDRFKEVVLCRSDRGFVKAREGSCKKRETQISFPVVNAETKCDAGELLDGDGNCVAIPTDTNTNADTLCDAGQILLGGGEGCFPVNQLSSYPCGNGQIDAGEQCDDGFAVNGPDGLCTSSCYNTHRIGTT